MNSTLMLDSDAGSLLASWRANDGARGTTEQPSAREAQTKVQPDWIEDTPDEEKPLPSNENVRDGSGSGVSSASKTPPPPVESRKTARRPTVSLDAGSINFSKASKVSIRSSGNTTSPKVEDNNKSPNLRALMHFVGFLIFCCVCGVALSAVELPAEERALRRHQARSRALYHVVSSAVEDGRLNSTALTLLRKTCELDLSNYFEPRWHIPGAFYFVVTVVTTIGCECFTFGVRLHPDVSCLPTSRADGNFVPVTMWGKIMTSFLCIFGLGYCGFMLTLCVERVGKFIVFTVSRLEKRSRVKPRNLLMFVGILNVAYILFLSSLGYVTGALTLGNSMYMAIITFTTIGLGDYAPPFFNKGRPMWYISGGYALAAVVMVLGLNLFTTLFSTIRIWFAREVRARSLFPPPPSGSACDGVRTRMHRRACSVRRRDAARLKKRVPSGTSWSNTR